jgi:cytochrome c553
MRVLKSPGAAPAPIHRLRSLRTLAGFSLASFMATLLACTGQPTLAAPVHRDATPSYGRLGDPALGHPANGQEVFRHSTFGDEPFWTDTLHLNEVVETAVSPATALAVGLKVDADRLPPGLLASADLKSPATTVELLRRDAVVGVEAQVTADNHIKRLGITCALCHSTVDNSVTAGVGHRLDGLPNHDLNVGAIVALSPAIPASAKAVYNSWGPGKYDAEFNRDGKNSPVVIPPALGLKGVARETYTAEGPVSYWNAYVAVTQMHGHGDFSDPALGIHIDQTPDLVTPVLGVLRDYQLGLVVPAPAPGSFDPAAAKRGQALFAGKANCARCHIPALHFTDVAVVNGEVKLHAPAEVCTDPVRASRLTNHAYRTTPLRALSRHAPYFHDGSAATLADVVQHYEQCMHLGLSSQEQSDLTEFLKTR